MDLGTRKAISAALWVLVGLAAIYVGNVTWANITAHQALNESRDAIRKSQEIISGKGPAVADVQKQTKAFSDQMDAITAKAESDKKAADQAEMAAMATQYPEAGITPNMDIAEARGRKDIAIQKRLTAAGGN